MQLELYSSYSTLDFVFSCHIFQPVDWTLLPCTPVYGHMGWSLVWYYHCRLCSKSVSFKFVILGLRVCTLPPSRWSALYCKQQQGPELSLAATNCGGGGGELEVTLSITGPRPLQPFHRTISFSCCTLHNNITFALSLDSFTRLWRLKTSQSQDSFTLWNYREEMVFDSVLENLILLNSKMVGLLKVSDLSC